MPWSPVTGLPIQYSEDASGTAASGHYLKFYASGTTTPINMATDSTGATTLAKCQLNSLGQAINGSSAVFIPHIDQKYKAVLYPDSTTADANTFASAIWNVDGTNPPGVDALNSVRAAGELIKEFDTMAAAIASTTIVAGDVLCIKDRASSLWDVSNSGSANTYNIVSLTGSGKYATLRLETVKDIRAFGALLDGSNELTLLQHYTDTMSGAIPMWNGTLTINGTWLFKVTGKHFIGEGEQKTKLAFVNASGGTCISGVSSSSSDLNTITDCSLRAMSVISTAAGTDFSIGIDLTTFSYSVFDIAIQSKRTNAILYYGQGNAGASPYYNWIRGSWFGGTSPTQVGLRFTDGLFSGGSPGGNANIIGPILRAASLDYFADIAAGNGNLFNNVNGESINTAYFRFNNRSAATTGTSTGSNGAVTFINSGASWTTNDYINGAVEITGGTGSGQVRMIASNNATTLTLAEPWAVLPDNTSTYAIYLGKASSNKISNFRAEGLSSDNPDFIVAKPGTSDTVVVGASVESLGSGLYVRNTSGSPKNKFYGEGQIILQYSVSNPGASANIDVFPRNSSLGGMSLAGNYVIEWLKVTSTTASGGDSLTVTLDSGGTATGNGDMTLQVVIPNGQSVGMDMPASTEYIARSGTNKSLFLNVATGGSFSATADVNVAICVTLV